jgi:two-component system, cell cycle response regulator CpdR
MKILVVDDERAFGSLLGRALKKLGHKATIAVHPGDALTILADVDQSFDAVITDIDMPVMNGVELAEEIRARNASIPIAFSTGSQPDDSVLRAAARIGKVLPKVWTVADVRALVDHLAQARLAHGSARMPPVTPSPQPAPRSESRREIRRLRLSLETWDDVLKLCERQTTDKPHVTLRGAKPVVIGEKVIVALALPDEMALSIGAVVVACTWDAQRSKYMFAVNLIELTPEVCVKLRSMCQAAGSRKRGGSYRKIERPANVAPASPTPPQGKPIGALSPRRR